MFNKDQQPPRLTRRDRRLQQLQQRKDDEARKKASKGLSSRRRFLIGLGAAVATAAVGIESFIFLRPGSQEMSLAELDEKLKDPKPIIQKEIERLGIKKNANEIQLWQGFSSSPRSEITSLDEILKDPSKRDQVQSTYHALLDAMKKSANTYFNTTERDITVLNNALNLAIIYSPEISRMDRTNTLPFMSAPQIDTQQHKFFWSLGINPVVLFNNALSITQDL